MTLASGPQALAALRIAVALCWLTLEAVHTAPAWAELPPSALPWGTAWLAPWVDPAGARVAQFAVMAGATLGLLGFYARFGFALVTVAGFYLLAIPQMHGAVQHHHHLLWFAALLAASPASDAFSVHRLRPASGTSRAWGIPTRIAWALLGAIYLFPGLHKLWAQGPAWAGENLTLLLYWKWAQSPAFTPLFRIDQWPTVLWLGGLAVLAFELCAPLLLFHRRGRLAFLVSATLFHLATAAFFDIRFETLLVCCVVLWPFGEEPAEPRGPVSSWRPAATVGALLVFGVTLSGTLGVTQAWPFACYPTFEHPVDRWMPTLAIVIDTPSGPPEILEPSDQAAISEAWALLGLYGPADPEALAQYVDRVRQRPAVRAALSENRAVHLHRARRSVLPDDPAVELGTRLATVEAQ